MWVHATAYFARNAANLTRLSRAFPPTTNTTITALAVGGNVCTEGRYADLFVPVAETVCGISASEALQMQFFGISQPLRLDAKEGKGLELGRHLPLPINMPIEFPMPMFPLSQMLRVSVSSGKGKNDFLNVLNLAEIAPAAVGIGTDIGEEVDIGHRTHINRGLYGRKLGVIEPLRDEPQTKTKMVDSASGRAHSGGERRGERRGEGGGGGGVQSGFKRFRFDPGLLPC